MNPSSPPDFSKWVPGFDFLQKLAATPTQSAPSASAWVAPTLDPKELEKRIQDLRTVKFWLEQNTQAVSATIQALEVQRMTLDTLQGMNVSMGHLAEALQAKPDPSPRKKAAAPKDKAEPGGVDPMAWWGSLTQQFGKIAGEAMQDMQRKAQSMAATDGTGAAAPSAASSAKAKAPAKSKRSTRPKSSK